MSRLDWVVFSVALTLLAYWASRTVHARYRSPLTIPVVMATACTMLVLALCGLGYAPYRAGAQLLISFLSPATVALAVPLYKHRHVMATYMLPGLVGLVCGTLLTAISAILLAVATGLPPQIVASAGIKSVTAPIAAELAPLVGGEPTLTTALVVATGILGATLGPWLLDRVQVKDPVGRGLAFGAICHGIGTAQAAAEGEIQGAVSAIAMGVAAVFVSLWAPTLIPMLMHLAK